MTSVDIDGRDSVHQAVAVATVTNTAFTSVQDMINTGVLAL